MRDREKKQYCPKCGMKMKYRGSHIFLCLHCSHLWEKTEGEWIKDIKDKKGKAKFFDRKRKGFRLISKTGKR